MTRIVVVMLVGLFLFAGCSQTRLIHPGTNAGIHNETILVDATSDSIEKANIDLLLLKKGDVYIEIDSTNRGRVYSVVTNYLTKNNIIINNNKEKSRFTLKISEEMAGVNQIQKSSFWWFIFGMTENTRSSQAKNTILVQIIDNETGKILNSNKISSEKKYSDITRNKIFWFVYFPIPIEEYYAEE